MLLWEVTLDLLGGFGYTCLLFALTLIFAVPLGLLIAFCAMSKWKPLKAVTGVIIWIVRGIPLMLQVCIMYYMPALLLGREANIFAHIDRFCWVNLPFQFAVGSILAVLLAFVINYACYFAEIYRGGIESISQGQYEAGQVLGLTKGQIFRHIVLGQVIKRILPSMSNEVITLVKDTALANVILLPEIIKRANEYAAKEGLIWPLFYTGIFYLAFVGGLTILLGRLEKKLNYYKT